MGVDGGCAMSAGSSSDCHETGAAMQLTVLVHRVLALRICNGFAAYANASLQ